MMPALYLASTLAIIAGLLDIIPVFWGLLGILGLIVSTFEIADEPVSHSRPTHPPKDVEPK